MPKRICILIGRNDGKKIWENTHSLYASLCGVPPDDRENLRVVDIIEYSEDWEGSANDWIEKESHLPVNKRSIRDEHYDLYAESIVCFAHALARVRNVPGTDEVVELMEEGMEHFKDTPLRSESVMSQLTAESQAMGLYDL